jgi:hypothetical protein
MKQSDKIKQLEQEIIDLKIEHKIEQHKKGYIHIDKNKILLFFAFLGNIAVAVGNFFVLIAAWKQLNIGTLFANNPTYLGLYQLGIIPILIFEYCLIGLAVVCFAAMIMGGFDKLKGINEQGLIFGLIAGLIVGLIIGLIFGLIVGLIIGLIFGLIFGLIAGLIAGLIVGLIEEFD